MRMSTRNRIPAIVGLLAFSLAALSFLACGGGGGEKATPSPAVTAARTPSPAATAPAATPTTAGTPAQTPAPQSASVEIRDFDFDPQTVTIRAGGTVTWTNTGTTHTVTADDDSFDSGDIANGKTFSHTFDNAGTYDYHCTIHPFMTGSVVVE